MQEFKPDQNFFGDWNEYARYRSPSAIEFYPAGTKNVVAHYEPDPDEPEYILVQNRYASPSWWNVLEYKSDAIDGIATRTENPRVLEIQFQLFCCFTANGKYTVIDFERDPVTGRYTHLFVGGDLTREPNMVYRWILTRKQFDPQESDPVIDRFRAHFGQQYPTEKMNRTPSDYWTRV